MPTAKPNYIIFITDDQGYGDLSCMGATDFRTPHLDRLAGEGCRFTSFYSNSPVCSPSRASLLSGRYPANAGVRSILAGHRTATGLPADVPSLATVLKGQGYRTALYGKWHLGLSEGSRPNDHGFDQFKGFLAGCVDYYSHIYYWSMNKGGPANDPMHDLWHNDREVWRNGEYMTEMITDDSVRFVREAAGEDEPFLLVVAYNAPHYPMHAPDTYMDRFAHLPWDRQVMAAMISAVDDGVGDVMAELARQGLAENTCTFFMSDNGPSRESRNWLDGTQDPYYGGCQGRLKGHKFSLYDGGIRVPGILHWPGRIPAGQVSDEPVAAMDIMPTFLAAAGADTAGLDLDGADILPAASGRASSPHERIFWEMNDQLAVRQGRWKLVLNGRLVEGAEPTDNVHLADLEADMSESDNLAERHPDLTAELKSAAEHWGVDVEARFQSNWGDGASGTTGRPTG